jgi:transcriptional regulator GlxA family with amidase domain
VITGATPVTALDVTGPFEVFSSVPGYQVELGNPDGASVWRTHCGLELANARPLHELDGPIDTLVIAGGPGSAKGVYDERFVEWIREAAQRSRRIASICTGTFLLAVAGLLDGKQAVTHWKFCDRLAREFPEIDVHRDPIYLRDGSVYTSAGITAGIDLSLAMLEEDYGHEAALATARQLVMFLVRPGGQSQFSHMLSRQAISSQPLRELQVWMLENLSEDLTVERLAERMGMSARHFTRVCLSEMRMTPGQFVDRLRVEAAQQMIDSSSMELKEIADACGFKTADTMRRAFLRVIGVSPNTYANRFKRAPLVHT